MGDFNLKVSDIFRYILLGCIECILCVVIFYDNIKSIDIENVKNTLRWRLSLSTRASLCSSQASACFIFSDISLNW